VIGRLGPAALATIVGVLGCGPSAISRAEFERRGNAICAATAARVDRLAAPRLVSTTQPEVVAGYVDAYVAELRQELSDLRLLGHPPGAGRPLGAAYQALDAALSAAEHDPLSFRAASLRPAGARLRALGLTACRP
jgi:hypothetical protein